MRNALRITNIFEGPTSTVYQDQRCQRRPFLGRSRFRDLKKSQTKGSAPLQQRFLTPFDGQIFSVYGTGLRLLSCHTKEPFSGLSSQISYHF